MDVIWYIKLKLKWYNPTALQLFLPSGYNVHNIFAEAVLDFTVIFKTVLCGAAEFTGTCI